MDPLANFKNQIESMFQKSFRDLSQKNSMNRTILANLMDAAVDQSNKITNLESNIERLRSNVSGHGKERNQNPYNNSQQVSQIKNQIEKQEHLVHSQFDKMMHRLILIEQGINNSKKRIQSNVNANKQAEGSLSEVMRQLQKIEREERIPQYRGTRDDLQRQIEEFQKILEEQEISRQVNRKSLQNYQQTLIEPLNNFQVRMNQHNKANQEILKDKLRSFTEKIRKVERRVEDAKNIMSSQLAKSQQQQRKILEEMNLMQHQMVKIRNNLQSADQQRRQAIQSNAANLDTMIEEMLIEAKKLQQRVDSLRKGYGQEAQRIKSQNRNFLQM